MIKITKNNLEKYYNDPNGNLYYFYKDQYYLVDGFTIEDITNALNAGIKFIFVEGLAQSSLNKK